MPVRLFVLMMGKPCLTIYGEGSFRRTFYRLRTEEKIMLYPLDILILILDVVDNLGQVLQDQTARSVWGLVLERCNIMATPACHIN